MTDDEGIDSEALQRRLPDGWEVTTNTGAVCGHTETLDPEEAAVGVDPTARFSIRSMDGSLWRASWRPPVDPDHGVAPVIDQITGTKERCIEWIVEKATGDGPGNPQAVPGIRSMGDPSNRALERVSTEMVYDWMDEAPHDELSEFLARADQERFFDEDGDPREGFLDYSGDWQADEVFTALWEGRSFADAGNVDAFETALGLAWARFGETELEAFERD